MMLCQEETEQGLEDMAQEQAEARAEVAVAKDGEVVFPQDRVGIASVQTVEKEQPIK